MSRHVPDHRLRHINIALFVGIFLINSYIIAVPFLPGLVFWWEQRSGQTERNLEKRLTSSAQDTPATSDIFHADAKHDGIIAPAMLLDTPLIEGPSSDSTNLLNKGAWLLPFSSTPDRGGNTVVAGHRFSYTGPKGVFYFLDKLQPGDDIGLWYRGTLYRYIVQSTRTHQATDVYIQEQTNDTRLTLYTCTPLWNPVNRLVVVATPMTKEETP